MIRDKGESIMNIKKFRPALAFVLATSMIAQQGAVIQLMAQEVEYTPQFVGEEAAQQVVEEVKLYKNDSASPWDRNYAFARSLHSNEPLGIEVMGKTEIEVLVTGENLTGTAKLNHHDVGQMRWGTEVPVGKPVRITIPKKSQLFLDVAGLKHTSDFSEELNIDVKVTLPEDSYKLSPVYDVRTQKLSAQATDDEEAFKQMILDADHGEDGSILISDNVRIYIPKSKFIPKTVAPKAVLEHHETIIRKYNEMANTPDRSGFSLVTGIEEMGGYMAASNWAFIVRPKAIFEYLKMPNEDPWGMYHEYGHNYEQGWGYQEYWNNIYANQLTRYVLNSPTWTWLYGDESQYEKNTVVPSFEKYLKDGTRGSIHPMYYFLSFIDHLDENFMGEITQFYAREGRYGEANYVAYFMAKHYGKNVIPYLEAAGHPITDRLLVRDIVEASSETIIHVEPGNERFEQIDKISMPVTMIADFANKPLRGMSNPGATIVITIDGEEYTTLADGKGKFEFELPVLLDSDSVVTVASIEPGKAKSYESDALIVSEDNSMVFKGYKNEVFLEVKIDEENRKFEAISSGKVANTYYSNKYAQIEHYGKFDELKNRYAMNGGQNANVMADQLNAASYEVGDYLKIYHPEQGRLSVQGYVENDTNNIHSSVAGLDLGNSYFYLTDKHMTYSDKKLSPAITVEDIKEKLVQFEAYNESDYTAGSWAVFRSKIQEVEAMLQDPNVTSEALNKLWSEIETYESLLCPISVIVGKGYNNQEFIRIGFDTNTGQLIAESTGLQANVYVGANVYFRLSVLDKDGQVELTYSIRGNENADRLAAALNSVTLEKGQKIQLMHHEPQRLAIQGYVIDAPYDLSKGLRELDLNKSYFHLDGESLAYTNGFNTAPQLSGVAPITVILGEEFDPRVGITATDAEDGDLTELIVIEGEVDTQTIGSYTLVYSVADSKGQEARLERLVEVIAKPIERDALKVVLEEADLLIAAGQGDYETDRWYTLVDAAEIGHETYLDPAATQQDMNTMVWYIQSAIQELIAYEAPDKTELKLAIEEAEALVQEAYTVATWEELTKQLQVAKNVYGSTANSIDQEHVNLITARLNAAIEALEQVVVEVPNHAPEIIGAEDVTVLYGEGFNSRKGVTAKDKEDGDLTRQIKISWGSDVSQVGKHYFTYSVEDSEGVKTEVVRVITVVEATTEETTTEEITTEETTTEETTTEEVTTEETTTEEATTGVTSTEEENSVE